jgi:predicted DNA-binding transcriptional regulator YafY
MVKLPVRVPGVIGERLAHEIGPAARDALQQTAEGVIDQLALAIEGYSAHWGGVTQDEPSAIRQAIDRAYQSQAALTIEYLSPARGIPTRRTIEPLLPVATHHGADYLEAWCQLEDGPRTFRIDRVLRIVPDDP